MGEDLTCTVCTMYRDLLQMYKREDRDTYCVSIRGDTKSNLYLNILLLGIRNISRFSEIDYLSIHFDPVSLDVVAVAVYDPDGNEYIITKAPEGKVDYMMRGFDGICFISLRGYDDNFHILDAFNSFEGLKQVVRSHFVLA